VDGENITFTAYFLHGSVKKKDVSKHEKRIKYATFLFSTFEQEDGKLCPLVNGAVS
jgi:hypothetical protein